MSDLPAASSPKQPENQPAMAPHHCSVTLLLIDVINDLEWEDGELIEPFAREMSAAIAALKQRAKALGIPVVYVNDNFGQWRSDFQSLVDHLLEDEVRGEFLARELHPQKDDYFVLKPKHSGFFGTTLDVLLDYLGAQTLILTGLAGNICVLFSANDAYMRDFKVVVPRDCLASNTRAENDGALRVMQHVLKADTRHSSEIDLEALIEAANRNAQEQVITSE
ncbi:MAG TPA: isochorismatase family cysteine hydrolase, partial [Abditibacterium sp.]